jgi:hypothetical protein
METKQKLTGIELIAQERKEQIEKHGRTVEYDVRINNLKQLSLAAELLITGKVYNKENLPPYGWDYDLWQKMSNKPYKDRIIIAGTLLAAEIDRLNAIEP